MELSEVPECAVCLQSCNHPTKLPCGHIFCFLCVKGVAIQNKCCAMCRQEIPPDYFENPILLESESLNKQASTEQQRSNIEESQLVAFQWYYEGRNGWWKYDERSNSELEAAHNSGATDCRLLLAGALYRVNFQTMLQYRRNDMTRRRRVKRDIPAAPAKGIAGIKIVSVNDSKTTGDHYNVEASSDDISSTEEVSVHTSHNSSSENDDAIIPPPLQFDLVNSVRSISLDSSTELSPSLPERSSEQD